MNLRHIAADIALMAVVCVAAMFLHPIAHGPYSAVHGPTTALRARYKALLTLGAMALAAFSLAARLIFELRLVALSALSLTAAASMSNAVPDSSPLRC